MHIDLTMFLSGIFEKAFDKCVIDTCFGVHELLFWSV